MTLEDLQGRPTGPDPEIDPAIDANIDAESGPLGRAWALTRPAEPSAEELDALWLDASGRIRLDARSTAPRLAGLGRRNLPVRRLLVGFAAAQAAAVIVGVGLLALGRGHEPEVAVVPDLPLDAPPKAGSAGDPPAATPPSPIRLVAEVDQTIIVRFGADGHRVDVIDESAEEPGPRPTTSLLADVTQHEVFNGWESIGTP